MKRLVLTIVATVVYSFNTITWAYDIAVENDDGVMIYYNYINDGQELEVTWGGDRPAYGRQDYPSKVVIPKEERYEGVSRKVTRIGTKAFWWCVGLTEVTIPDGVTSIGDQAFGYSRLSSVNIPQGVTSIGEQAFYYCTWLTSVTIPNSVTWIGKKAFLNCHSVSSITIPNSVQSIEEYTFAHCALTSVTIPNSVTSIGDAAFWQCQRLTSVTILNSVTHIGEAAFKECYSLTSVTIGSGVTSIDKNAFGSCTRVEKVVSLIKDPFAIAGVFDEYIYDNAILYVPQGTIDKYRATVSWNNFATIKESDEDAVSEVKAVPVLIQADGNALRIEGAQAGTTICVYDLCGRLIGQATATEGSTRVEVLTTEKVVVVRLGERCVKVAR